MSEDELREQIEELETQLSSAVSARDLTIRDLRAEVELLRGMLRDVYPSLPSLADGYEDAAGGDCADEDDIAFVKAIRELHERIRTKMTEPY